MTGEAFVARIGPLTFELFQTWLTHTKAQAETLTALPLHDGAAALATRRAATRLVAACTAVERTMTTLDETLDALGRVLQAPGVQGVGQERDDRTG